jgi:hypothetical protein
MGRGIGFFVRRCWLKLRRVFKFFHGNELLTHIFIRLEI